MAPTAVVAAGAPKRAVAPKTVTKSPAAVAPRRTVASAAVLAAVASKRAVAPSQAVETADF